MRTLTCDFQLISFSQENRKDEEGVLVITQGQIDRLLFLLAVSPHFVTMRKSGFAVDGWDWGNDQARGA